MALTFASLAKDFGYGVGGATGGGVSSLTAIGAQQKISGAIETKLMRVGNAIGKYTGSNIFQSLAAGAQQGNASATSALLSAHGINLKEIFIIGLIAAGVTWAVFFRQ